MITLNDKHDGPNANENKENDMLYEACKRKPSWFISKFKPCIPRDRHNKVMKLPQNRIEKV